MKSNIEIDDLFISNPDQAFELIYSNYYNMLCNHSLRITYDRSSAEDVVQEVILELWNKKETIKFDSSIIAYLKRAVYNRSLNFVKAKAMHFEQEDELIDKSNGKINVVDEMIGVEVREKVKTIIEKLPLKCRTVFALSRFEEKSYKEIADELGISIKTVENQISKALKILRSNLN